MQTIPLFTATAAHFALQGVDMRGCVRLADTELEASSIRKWSSESFASARTEQARTRRTDRLNRRTFAARNAELVAATGGVR